MGTKQGMPTGPVTLRKAMDNYLLDAKSRTSIPEPPMDTPVPTLRLGGGMQDTFSEADSQLAQLQMKLEQLKTARDSLPYTSTSNSMSTDFAMTRSLNFPSDADGEASSFSLR